MTAQPSAADREAAQRQAYAEMLAPALVENEGMDPNLASYTMSVLLDRVTFDGDGMPVVTAEDGTPSNPKAEVAKIRAAKPFAFTAVKTKTETDSPKVVVADTPNATAAMVERKAALGSKETRVEAALAGGNPFAKATWNMSRQAVLVNLDPSRAEKLQAEAGR